MNILMALMRFGSRYAKGLSRPGLRVAGKTSRGKKVRGVLKRGKKGNFVISNQSVPTSVSKSDASRLTRSAKRASTVRKGLVGGGVGGSAIVGSTVANRKQPKSEPTYTEKNPGGMRFKAAPKMSTKKQTFSQAFKQAYAGGKGKGTIFTWKGKKFVALTKEDTGGKTIKEYYASKKKKKK